MCIRDRSMYRQEIRLDVKRVILFSFSDRWLLIWNAGRFRSLPGRSRCEEKNLTFLFFWQSIRDGYIQKSRFINRSGVRKYRLMWIMQWPVRWNNYGRSWERIPKAHLISRTFGVWVINSVMEWMREAVLVKVISTVSLCAKRTKCLPVSYQVFTHFFYKIFL